MKILIKSTFDEETQEDVIESFSCLPNNSPLTRGYLPNGVIVVDGSSVPREFFTDWKYYRVNRLVGTPVEWSRIQYQKYHK